MAPIPEVDALIEKYVTGGTPNSPGCSLAIAKGGQIIHCQGYGLANLDYGIPNTPSTVFNAASLAKQFTAMSILLISKEIVGANGKVSLDDDIRQYIPDRDLNKNKIPKITILQLLHHTAGIRDMLVLLTLAGWRWGDDVITRENILDFVRRMITRNFDPPGSYWSYSNTDYFLAGEIIKHATGDSLSKFAHDHIFAELGMTSTRIVEKHGEIVANRAHGYRRLEPPKKGFEMTTYTYDFTGPASLFTTVEDLLRWDRNFVSKKVGGDVAVTKLQEPYKLDGSYAMGLYVAWDKDTNKPIDISHNGRHAGYRAQFSRWYKHPLNGIDHITVALLCNLEIPKDTREVTEEIARVVGLGPLAERTTRPELPKTQIAAGVIPPSALTLYEGEYYSDEIDTIFRVRIQGTSLEITRHTYPPISLTHVSGDKFKVNNFTAVLDNPGVSITFLRQNGAIAGFRMDDLRTGTNSRLVNFIFTKR